MAIFGRPPVAATAANVADKGDSGHALPRFGAEALHAMERTGEQLAHETVTIRAEASHTAERAGRYALQQGVRAGDEVVHAARVLRKEPFWQAQAVLVCAVVLYLALPSKLIVGPSWLMPAAELLLVGGLWLDPPRSRVEAARERRIVLTLLGLVAASNFFSPSASGGPTGTDRARRRSARTAPPITTSRLGSSPAALFPSWLSEQPEDVWRRPPASAARWGAGLSEGPPTLPKAWKTKYDSSSTATSTGSRGAWSRGTRSMT
jgi:hypothetical protein